MVFFDLETFQDKNLGHHVPYACGFSYSNHNNVHIGYSKNCMDEFINHLLTVEDKIVCAYNGAGFDFFILLHKLKDRGIKNIIISNGCV